MAQAPAFIEKASAAGERVTCLAAGDPRIHADLLARFPDADG